MLLSKFLLPTLKERPKDAEIISHKLMLRAGMIRKVGAGIYNFLPLCFKVIQKIETIIREEMNKADALELLMPILTPSELWIESKRWDVYGKELMRIKDRHNRDFALGPTHEEVITDIIRKEIKSYKQLPICLYQIQTKFRDEIRPRFGVMRSREFIMKDAYSFHSSEKSLDEYYKIMYKTYSNIFKRCGLKFRAVLADSGAIGGETTHEFMVLANSGESLVISCPDENCGYAATNETAVSKYFIPENEDIKKMEEIHTPNKKSIEEVSEFLNQPAYKFVKTLIYKAEQYDKINYFVVLIRGDREVNEIKLLKILSVNNIELADEENIKRITGSDRGFAGPINLKEKVQIIADKSIKNLTNFVTGANKTDYHFINANLTLEKYFDISMAKAGDKCINCGKTLTEYRGIEVGQIFKLGTKYSKSLNAVFNNENGKLKEFIMGCYGIGVTRIIAASIEQNNDDNGIIWPKNIAPYQIHILPLNKKNTNSFKFAMDLYLKLKEENIEVVIDDRPVGPGFKFKDADLIGIPLRIIVGKEYDNNQTIEYSFRKNLEKKSYKVDSVTELINFIKTIL